MDDSINVFDYIFLGSCPSVFGFIKQLKERNKDLKILIIEEGDYNNEYIIGDAYYENVTRKIQDASGKSLILPYGFSDFEIFDDFEMNIGSEYTFIEDTIYSYQNVKKVYEENGFNNHGELHYKTNVCETIVDNYEKFYEDDVEINYSTHRTQLKTNSNGYTKTKFRFFDLISEYENIVILFNHKLLGGTYMHNKNEYTITAIKCVNNRNEEVLFVSRKEVILGANAIKDVENLDKLGIGINGWLIKNEHIGNNIMSKLEFDIFCSSKNNKVVGNDIETRQNKLYYNLRYIFNNKLVLFFYGFFFGSLFNLMYSETLTTDTEWLRKYLFATTAFFESFGLLWSGLNLFLILSYVFGSFISFVYFISKGHSPIWYPALSVYYWVTHFFFIFFFNYLFNRGYISPGTESLVALNIKANYVTQKIVSMSNMDYKLMRIYFYNIYDKVKMFFIRLFYYFGFRYLFLRRIFLITTTTILSFENGSYTKDGDKFVLNLKLKLNEDNGDNKEILSDLEKGVRDTISILSEIKRDNKLSIYKIYPFFKINTKYIFENSRINHLLSGSCRFSQSKEIGVVDGNGGLKIWGTSNMRIISPSFYSGCLDGNEPLIYYIFGILTAKSIK